LINIEELKDKFEPEVFQNLDKENVYKILDFLYKECCDFIDDLIENYLDLFNFEYEDFVIKYNLLNDKYNGEFLSLASEDMNLLEEFYEV